MSLDRTTWNGMTLPLVNDVDGKFTSKTSGHLIWSSIMMILTTSKGERWMNPSFGSDVRKLLHEPNDRILELQLLNEVRDSLIKWEPRIVVRDVQVVADENQVTISLNYTVVNEAYEEFRSLNLLRLLN